MRFGFLKRYFSIIFVIATLVGVFHHHNDLKTHSECQICILSSSIADADTPDEVIYITNLQKNTTFVVSELSNLYLEIFSPKTDSRAPPSIL